MRNSPLNYLLTFALYGFLWVLFGVFANMWLCDNIAFNELSPEDFSPRYQVILAVATLLGFVFSAMWYSFGSKKENCASMSIAKRKWNMFLLLEIATSITVFGVFATMFASEGLTGVQFGLVYIGFASVTFLPYWLTSLICTPEKLENCPVGKR